MDVLDDDMTINFIKSYTESFSTTSAELNNVQLTGM